MIQLSAFKPFALFLAAAPLVHACGACGCTLNSDWAIQGLSFRPGFRLDLRGDYFDQDQLRSGTKSLSGGSFSLPQDFELQRNTLNRNLLLGLDYSPNPNWGFTLQIPIYDRFHATYAAGDTDLSTSRERGAGDIKLVARYQGLRSDGRFGLQFGLKLPTGRFSDRFKEGPQAGEPLDRGLQLGTGTTDLIVGIFSFGDLSGSWSYFAQAQYQAPMNSREDFRPSAGVNASVGLRYAASERIIPHLQVNLRAEGRESGANADVGNSGATLAYLSPGVTLPFGNALQVYAFVQVPIAQRVNGLQIEPKISYSLGLHYHF